ncbi:hypothetical protein PVAP13_9KG137100 [Panicum virgatum]|uniref:Uncharacterized protein n=1 Tax=Panicum virgatum TaxID=38727 RepID=A0A8T0NIM7_PANVG|nr:hypothetical protein PVAP13_9KG137100 [Panicum virgatum]
MVVKMGTVPPVRAAATARHPFRPCGGDGAPPFPSVIPSCGAPSHLAALLGAAASPPPPPHRKSPSAKTKRRQKERSARGSVAGLQETVVCTDLPVSSSRSPHLLFMYRADLCRRLFLGAR